MKRIIILFITVSLMFLAACGSQALEKGEVLNQAIEEMQNIDSYSADIEVDTDFMGMEVAIEGTTDITQNPDALYMEMTMEMMGMSMDTKTYIVDEEIFMEVLGEWMIMSDEELGLDNFNQMNEEELNKLDAFEEQFEMTEEDNMYVLTLSGEGEEFEQLAEPYLESVMQDFPGDVEEVLNFSVESFDMKLQVDKETMLIISQTVGASIEMDGESYQVDATMTISNINEVEPIEVPEEVRENAVTEDFMDDMFEYEEESMTLEEIQELVDYTIPQVSNIPEGYEMTESYYDESWDMPYFIYEKDIENTFILSVYPSKEEYGDLIDEAAEKVSINGNEGQLEIFDEDLMYITWEHNDVFLELIGEGSEISKDILLQIAESVE